MNINFYQKKVLIMQDPINSSFNFEPIENPVWDSIDDLKEASIQEKPSTQASQSINNIQQVSLGLFSNSNNSQENEVLDNHSAHQLNAELLEVGEQVVAESQEIEKNQQEWQTKVNSFIERLQVGEDRQKVMQEITDALNEEAFYVNNLFEARQGMESGIDKSIGVGQGLMKTAMLMETLAENDFLDEFNSCFSSAYSGLSEAVVVVGQSINLCVVGKKIKLLNQQLEKLKNQLENGNNLENPEELKLKIKTIENQVDELKEEIKEGAQDLCTDVAGAFLSESQEGIEIASFIATCAHASSHVLADLAIAGSSIGLASSVLGVSLEAAHTFKSSKKLKNFHQEKLKLNAEIKDGEDPIKNTILQMRMDHLDIAMKEEKLNLAQSVAKGMSIGLSTAGAVKVIVVASGASLGLAGSVSLSVVGGLGVATSAILTGGAISYAAYQNRHRIKYTAQASSIIPRLSLKKRRLQKMEGDKVRAETNLEKANAQMLLLGESGNVLDNLDKEETGTDAIEKKKLAQQQFEKHQFSINDAVNTKIKSVEDLSSLDKNMKLIKKDIKDLTYQLKSAKSTKQWNQLKDSFRKYKDIETLLIVESMISEQLSDSQMNKELTSFIEDHGFKPVKPLTFDQVLDYILMP